MVDTFLVVATGLNTVLAVFAAWQRHQTVAPVLRKRAKARRKAARKAATA